MTRHTATSSVMTAWLLTFAQLFVPRRMIQILPLLSEADLKLTMSDADRICDGGG